MATVKKTAFGSAFAAARAKGDRTFEFGGKKYTTAQKGESGKQTVAALSKAYEKTTGLPQKVAQMAPKATAPTETQPMGKREVDLSVSTKKGNLFQRIGERIKQRQLARANRSVGTPMKSTTSVPSTPTPSAPQREMNATDKLKMALQAKSAPQRTPNATDALREALQAKKSQPLSVAAKGMLDKYMSKKYMGGGKMEYMGGGKMKKYAKGGMIEKNKVKPTSDSTYYYAEKEYISKLKGLTANSKPEMDKQFALQDKAKHDRWRQGNKGKPGYDKNGFLIKNETTKTKKYAKGGMIEKEGMKPKGKMDKKKAFLEMIAKLKAKKK